MLSADSTVIEHGNQLINSTVVGKVISMNAFVEHGYDVGLKVTSTLEVYLSFVLSTSIFKVLKVSGVASSLLLLSI